MSGNTTSLSGMNPKIREVEIGTRDLRRIRIYPLSMKDQLELSDLISEGITGYFQTQNEGDSLAAFVAFCVRLIKDNMARLLSILTDEEGSNLIGEIDNDQLTKIADIVFEVNFGGPLKNLTSLLEKYKTIMGKKEEKSHSRRLSRQSVKPTDTDQNIST